MSKFANWATQIQGEEGEKGEEGEIEEKGETDACRLAGASI